MTGFESMETEIERLWRSFEAAANGHENSEDVCKGRLTFTPHKKGVLVTLKKRNSQTGLIER